MVVWRRRAIDEVVGEVGLSAHYLDMPSSLNIETAVAGPGGSAEQPASSLSADDDGRPSVTDRQRLQ